MSKAPFAMPLHRHARASSAFTLIELLTVIAIIGILAAIIIPTVGKVRESARAAQCVSNLRQVATALRLCADDNRGQLPPASAASTDTYWFPAGGSGSSIDWSRNPRFTVFLPQKQDSNGSRHEVLTCPSNDYESRQPASAHRVSHTYAYGPGASGINDFRNDSSAARSRALSSITNPSQAIFLLEAKRDTSQWKIPASLIGRDRMLSSFTSPGTESEVQFWHGGGNRTNVAFGDGSVRGFSASELAQRYPSAEAIPSFRIAAGL